MFSKASSKFLGTTFHNITFMELCDGIDKAKNSGNTMAMMSLNLDILTKLHHSAEFRQASQAFSAILVDSTPLLKIMKKQGIHVKEKLAGSDLMPRLCRFAADRRYSCYILGGAPGTPEAAAANLKKLYPELNILGYSSPKFGFTQSHAACEEIARELEILKPDLLFVCLGAPKAELFISRYLLDCGIPSIFSVGAAVDFCAGTKARAPIWVQRAGFEWLFRFFQEPKRLFRRYFIDSWSFLSIYMRNR